MLFSRKRISKIRNNASQAVVFFLPIILIATFFRVPHQNLNLFFAAFVFGASLIFWELQKRYVNNALSLIYTFNGIIYFFIPICFLAIQGQLPQPILDMWSDAGPRSSNAFHFQGLPFTSFWAILFQNVGAFCLCGKFKKEIIPIPTIKNIKFLTFFSLICLFIFQVSMDWHETQMHDFNEISQSWQGYFTFLFNDRTLLLCGGTILLTPQNSKKEVALGLFMVITGLWFSQMSKGVILKLFIVCFLIPFSLLSKSNRSYSYYPKASLLIMLVVSAFCFYGWNLIRVQKYGILKTAVDPKELIDTFNVNKSDQFILESINNGVDRMSNELVYCNAILVEYPLTKFYHERLKLWPFFMKTVLNQLIPGTLFPEVAGASSWAIPAILAHQSPYWYTLTYSGLPYTFVGFLSLCFGVFALPVFAIAMIFMNYLSSKINDSAMWLGFASFFFGLTAFYGLETLIILYISVFLAAKILFKIGTYRKI